MTNLVLSIILLVIEVDVISHDINKYSNVPLVLTKIEYRESYQNPKCLSKGDFSSHPLEMIMLYSRLFFAA